MIVEAGYGIFERIFAKHARERPRVTDWVYFKLEDFIWRRLLFFSDIFQLSLDVEVESTPHRLPPKMIGT